jgi:diguanylate cyclase (GGDEF)-like protein
VRNGKTAGRSEVRVLAAACAGAGLVTLGTVVVPFSATAPTGLGLALGTLALLIAAGLALAARRVPVAVLHAVVVVASTAVTACVASSTTAAGPGVTACSYSWVALYAAFHFHRRALAVHLLLVAGGFAVGLALSGAPSAPQTWWFVMVTLTAVSATVHVLTERLRRSASTDPLTGLLTRPAFRRRAELEMGGAARTSSPLSLVVIDLDDFKAVNDTHGHARGDDLLASTARVWRRVVRPTDVLGRHGGDEFVLLLPATRAADVAGLLHRMRAADPGGRWSAGVAQWEGEPFDDWLAHADRRLYVDKSLNRTARETGRREEVLGLR